MYREENTLSLLYLIRRFWTAQTSEGGNIVMHIGKLWEMANNFLLLAIFCQYMFYYDLTEESPMIISYISSDIGNKTSNQADITNGHNLAIATRLS